MSLRLLSISHKTPSWIETGYLTYAKRLHSPYDLSLIEAKPAKLSNKIDRLKREDQTLLALIKPNHLVIAMDEHGEQWTTQELAQKLLQWLSKSSSIDFLIGGADGLGDASKARANHIWSLSKLTFPHQLVRILIAEQIYRAFSLVSHHPYHR